MDTHWLCESREEIGEWISEVAEAVNLYPKNLWISSSSQNTIFPSRMWFISISICDEWSEHCPKTWLLLTRSDCHADYSASDRRPIHAYAFDGSLGTRLREGSEREGGRWAE